MSDVSLQGRGEKGLDYLFLLNVKLLVLLLDPWYVGYFI